MRNRNLKRIALSASVGAVIWLGASASAATLQDIFDLSAEGTRIAQASQARVDALSDETQDMLQDYRAELRTIEDLQAYNIQKEREIADQQREIRTLRSSIERATMIDRQILPLVANMTDVLELFIANDIPFKLEERRNGIDLLRENMDSAEVSTSEKFRLIFDAYQAENNYGREFAVEDGTIVIDGRELAGKLMHVGRVALYFQTQDESTTAHWNPATKDWEVVDSSYAREINQLIKMAEGQIAPDLVRLPLVDVDGGGN